MTSSATSTWKPSDVPIATVGTGRSTIPYAPAGKVAGVQPRRSSATMRLSENASGRSGRKVLAASIDGDGIPMNCHNPLTVPALYNASCSS
jgi:hypothetical protein